MSNGDRTAVQKVERIRTGAGLPAESWPDARIETIAKTCAPEDTQVPELAMFLGVANRYDLDPLVGEIWLAKDRGELMVLTGRDSYLKIAQRDPGYEGFDSGVVYEDDDFRIRREGSDITVEHTITGMKRGDITGAYAVVYHAERKPVLKVRRWSQYKHLHGKTNWRENPDAMIETRALVAALREQFNISGLYTQSEVDTGTFETRGGPSAEVEDATLQRLDELEAEVIEDEEHEDEDDGRDEIDMLLEAHLQPEERTWEGELPTVKQLPSVLARIDDPEIVFDMRLQDDRITSADHYDERMRQLDANFDELADDAVEDHEAEDEPEPLDDDEVNRLHELIRRATAESEHADDELISEDEMEQWDLAARQGHAEGVRAAIRTLEARLEPQDDLGF